MTWASQGLKLQGAITPGLLQAISLSKFGNRFITSHKPNQFMINFPESTIRIIPVTTQRSTFTSSSKGGQGNSRTKATNIFVRPPAIAAYTTVVGAMDENEVKKNPNIVKPICLTVGAAWAPKRPRQKLPSWCIADCGEDAFFATIVNKKHYIGVADGVGGWSEIGVDPSQFAWELMNNCKEHSKNMGDIIQFSPKTILNNAYNQLVQEKKVKAGSSTACLAVVDTETGILSSVNLGDSGYIIIRGNSVFYHSKETTHYFNAPYQLSVIPPELDKGRHIKNSPLDGHECELQLQNGDIIVMGTDGLFDNLFDHDILNQSNALRPNDFDKLLLEKNAKNLKSLKSYPNQLAGSLVKLARERAQSKTHPSPFSTEAKKHGYRCSGGKMDDITVVVALVTLDNAKAKM